MSRSETVSLKVRNALGQEVFVKKFVLEAGLNTITIHRSDTEGHSVASGAYIVMLQTESGMRTVKMVVE